MNILIAGASGFIGTLITNHLSEDHSITVLGRNLEKLESIFSKKITKLTWSDLKTEDTRKYHLIINLSGSNIGAKAWNLKVKKELIESRVKTNQLLIKSLIKDQAKPRFLCASAVGIYGAHEQSSNYFDEHTPLPQKPQDFLQTIGYLWEESLQEATAAHIPVTNLRFGVVLKKREGMLKKLELPFRLGLGSILGKGEQILSWIHYKDLIKAIDFIIKHPELKGPVNITSPQPVAQKDFATKFSKVLKRPLFIKMPSWFIKIIFGEMGDQLLLKGQKVIPEQLTALGFQFSYLNVEDALFEEYGNS